MAGSKSFLEQVVCAEFVGSVAKSLSLSTAVEGREKDVMAASLKAPEWLLVGNLLVIHRRLHE